MDTKPTISIALPDWVETALSVLEEAGFEAWLVGGCVRDSILGRPVHDYDIATDASWQDVERAFSDRGFATHETGVKHGTITAVVGGNALEITTFRTDCGYSDGRHPDRVAFVKSIEEDLARRDFTINAMAYHPERGLRDPYGGYDDIGRRAIRCVGDPDRRFREDSLRILRGCRFASQLGFTIEAATLEQMVHNKLALQRISAERVTAELQELLCGEYVHDALMATFDALCGALPEIAAMKGFEQHTPYHIYDVWEHTAYVVQYAPAEPLIRWAALLHDSGKPAAFFLDGERGHFYGHARLSVILAKSVLGRLCFSQAFVSDALALIQAHDDVIQPAPRPVKRALARLGGRTDLFRALCELKRADAMAQAPRCAPRIALAEDLMQTLDEILESKAAFTVKDLAIGGRDLMEMGVKPGPDLGMLLQRALDAVIDEEVENERGELLALMERLID